MMLSRLLICFTFVVALGGCNFIKKTFNKAAPGVATGEQTKMMDPSGEPPPAPPSGPKCNDGSDAQIVTGDCEGQWEVARNTEKKLECRFKWGPRVGCPAGTTAVGNGSVCYGTTIRALGANEKSTGPEDCEKMFGKFPQSPSYQLICCTE